MKLSKEEREILREAEQEAEHEELFSHDRHKKTFLHIIAIFILGISLLYFLFSIPTFSDFIGFIESEHSDDNIFNHKGKTIILDQKIYDYLNENYDIQAEHESIYCLKGTKINETYKITFMYQPRIYSQTYGNVRFESCQDDTLIILHTHPIKSCLPSETDLNTLESFQRKNQNALMAVMCDVKRINFYS